MRGRERVVPWRMDKRSHGRKSRTIVKGAGVKGVRHGAAVEEEEEALRVLLGNMEAILREGRVECTVFWYYKSHVYCLLYVVLICFRCLLGLSAFMCQLYTASPQTHSGLE